jgi:acetyl/propionyl-CoA carboxylase alpha subunit
VTELTCGVDLVRAQLLVAAGEPLPWAQDALASRGHAVEARVYAEDPSRGFLPQAGRILAYRAPAMPGVRIDSGITGGSEVPVHYDPLLAKVIAWAETRELAIRRLSAALGRFEIEGVATNLAFVRQVLDHPAFRSGEIDTGFLDRETDSLVVTPSSVANPPSVVSVSYVGSGFSRTTPPTTDRSPWWDPWQGDTGRQASAPRPTAAPALRRRAAAHGVQSLTAPMPATVISVLVKVGDAIAHGDTLVVLEAMKMELPLRAAGDAVVKAVHCEEGELVQADAVLIELE